MAATPDDTHYKMVMAVQLASAMRLYRGIDPSKFSTSSTIRATTRQVLYTDLFQSQFGNYLFSLLRLDFGLSLGLNSRRWGRSSGKNSPSLYHLA